jgi:hypothetical protein
MTNYFTKKSLQLSLQYVLIHTIITIILLFFLFHIIHYTLQFHLSFIFQSARRVDEGTLKMCINLFVNTAQSSRVENISDMMILKRKIYYSITSFVCDCVTVAFLFLFSCSSIASPSQSNTIETQH